MSPARRALDLVFRYAFRESGNVARLVGTASTLGLTILAGWLGGLVPALVVLGLAGVAAVGFVAAFRMALTLDRHEREPRVCLVFREPELAHARTVTPREPESTYYGAGLRGANEMTTTVLPTRSDLLTYARARVATDPPPGVPGKRAERVAARIEFLDDEGNALVPEMDGRWSETPQPGERPTVSTTLDGAVLDIDANGIAHPLDVAMKRPGDSHFYAYNDENMYVPAFGLEKHRITADRVRVRITLRPGNADREAREFVLTNGGSSGTLDLSFADEPTTT